MYICKLSATSQTFLTYLSGAGVSFRPVTTVAIAKALANYAPLPSSELEDASVHYRLSVQQDLLSLLSSVNEMVVVDVKQIQEQMQAFYLARYTAAFGSKVLCCLNAATVIEDFFGLSKTIPPSVFTTLKEDPIILTKVYNGMMDLIKDIISQQ